MPVTQEEFATFVANLESNQDMSLESHTLRSVHAVLGMAGETGEIVDHIKKVFVYKGFEFERGYAVEELGDLFYYMTLLMNVHGITLDEVRDANMRKLQVRYPDGYSHERAINRNHAVERAAMEAR